MTIIEMKTQNVKALKAVRLTPEPTGIVEIAGKNGAGKSAVLDAIKWALAGGRAIQERPVRDGQAGASTELDLGDYTIRQDIAVDGKCRLTLRSKDGGSFPQAWLSAATNSIVLEPEEFVRKPAREQSTVLRQLVGLDTSELDREREKMFADRTIIGRDGKRLAGALASLRAEPERPAELCIPAVDRVDLAPHYAALSREQGAIARQKQFQIDLRCKQEAATHLAEEIADLQDALKQFTADIARLEGAIAEAPPSALDEVTAALAAAKAEAALADAAQSAYTRQVAAYHAAAAAHQAWEAERAQLTGAVESARAEYEQATAKLVAIDAEKATRLAAAAEKMPIPGLAATESGITYRGVPFSQASTAEQILVATAIGLGLAPKIRVVLIHDGSLLDADSLAKLGELATRQEAQVWIERVGEDGAIVIEDGEVRA